MAHTAQRSMDIPELFLGVMVHDGTPDLHGHVFGGVNWINNVRFGVRPPRPAPMAAPGAASLASMFMIHVLPPHAGEPRGANLGRLIVPVQAPMGVAGNQRLANVGFASRPHGTHRDDMVAALFGVANGGAIKACLAIVMAVHYGQERNFILISDGQNTSEALTAGAAVALNREAGVGVLALGVLGAKRSALNSVRLRAGEADIKVAFAKDDLDEAADTGFCGLSVFEFEPKSLSGAEAMGIVADLGKAGRWEAEMVPAARFAKDGAEGTDTCRPGSVKATKWGGWKPSEDEAAADAFEAARRAADKACHGTCAGKSCKYTETATELLETEDKQDGQQVVYRSKVKSEGRCECQ